jgi:hypothetical protein
VISGDGELLCRVLDQLVRFLPEFAGHVEATTIDPPDQLLSVLGRQFALPDATDEDADGAGDGRAEATGDGADAAVVGDDETDRPPPRP